MHEAHPTQQSPAGTSHPMATPIQQLVTTLAANPNVHAQPQLGPQDIHSSCQRAQGTDRANIDWKFHDVLCTVGRCCT